MNAERAARALERAHSSADDVKRIIIIKQDNRLLIEARLAWPDLFFDFCEGNPATIAVSPGQVGAIIGRGDKAGRRILLACDERGYGRIVYRPHDRADWARKGSKWQVQFLDPLEVARGRLARECDGQTEFPEFGEEPEILSIGDRAMGEQPAAEAAALARSRDVKRTAKVDPLSPCPDLRLKSAALQTSDLRLKDDGVTSIASALQRSQVSRTEHGQTDEDSAVPGITTIGGLANGILSQLPTPIARLQQIRELSARIYQEVGDPKFHREKADELAEAIVDGRWTERLYNRVLMSTRKAFAGETRSGIPRVPRWAYFLGAALNSIKENDPRGR